MNTMEIRWTRVRIFAVVRLKHGHVVFCVWFCKMSQRQTLCTFCHIGRSTADEAGANTLASIWTVEYFVPAATSSQIAKRVHNRRIIHRAKRISDTRSQNTHWNCCQHRCDHEEPKFHLKITIRVHNKSRDRKEGFWVV